MDYRQLGNTGVRVSPLCLGVMNFGPINPDEHEGVATIHAALDAGINFIDTANVYGRGSSETITGTALRGRRDEVVLATKVHGHMGDGPNDWGNSRRHIVAQCEQSLKRLQTDWIDLYQLHRPDPTTPIEESLQALDDLVRAGKVRYVGLSTFPTWQTMEALALADRRHLASGPVSEQPPYNLLDRRIETELVPLAQKYGLAILPWSPLSSGILTGKYSSGQAPDGSRFALPGFDERTADPKWRAAVDTAAQLGKLAAEASVSLTALSLAWLMQQPAVTAPIIGPRNRQQLTENLDALTVDLDAGLLKAIDDIVAPGEAVYPL